MSENQNRKRGQAYTGMGYGTRRRLLFESARDHIEHSIALGFYCEAIAIIDSVITDRLESRLSWLTKKNIGFKTLGWLVHDLRVCETDPELRQLLTELDDWCKRRNGAIHELVKVEADKPDTDWETRMGELAISARAGYELLKRLYHRVADLNPQHHDRVFGYPSST